MSTMLNASMETRSRNVSSSDGKDDPSSADAPSGFILKLYQMVNGAPNEVISWTPTGDAFIIGSDLKRLESETLPQYFRHNRFQSLVRQLNFYSFRKINRERNVWIYKHELFHRERPEDLHLVRRRTCPGLDGRKQRFSRYSARKLTDNNSGSDDESSVEVSPPAIPPPEARKGSPSGNGAKRQVSNADLDASTQDSKKRRSSWNNAVSANVSIEEEDIVVDTSLLARVAKQVSREEEDWSQESVVNERSEMAERSLVISEVAKKLEQFARKAFGHGGKGKRSSTGVVTPPFGSRTVLPTTDLFSYDDEHAGHMHGSFHGNGTGVITDAEESTASADDDASAESVVFASPSAVFTTPVADAATAEGIANRLIQLGLKDCETKAAVVSFCVTSVPSWDKDAGIKILRLIASCRKLESDFQTYRAALDPLARVENGGTMLSSLAFAEANDTMQIAWEREASRSKAVHDFTVFAVNCIQTILGDIGAATQTDSSSLGEDDFVILERTIQVWSKNV